MKKITSETTQKLTNYLLCQGVHLMEISQQWKGFLQNCDTQYQKHSTGLHRSLIGL